MGKLKSGWLRVRFGDVVRLVSERCDPVSSGIDRFVGLEHIEPGDLRVRSWGDVADGTTFTNRFRLGQVLFGKRRAYQRKVAIADFDGVCSGDIYVLESADPGRLLPELLPFICQTNAFFEHAVGTSAGSLSPRTSWTSLGGYEFVLPPLVEQRRIATRCAAIKDLIDTYVELIESTRLVKRSLLANFIAGLGRLGSTKLSDVAKVVRGSTPRPAGDPRYFNGSDVPWITVGELTRDESALLRRTETMLTQEGARHSRLLSSGTVVLSNSGFSLGVPKILAIDGCANDGVAAFLELDPSMDPEFLYYCLLSLTEYFRNVVAAGGDQPNLNTARIGAVEVPRPPLSEQRHAVEVVATIDAKLHDTAERLRELRFHSVRQAESLLGGTNGI